MIRAVGAAMVVACSTGLGFAVARSYRDRWHQVRQLAAAVRLLQSEIEFGAVPLPQALRYVCEHAEGAVRVLFSTVADELSNPGRSVSDAVQIGVHRCAASASLLPADWQVVTEFGQTLGTSDSVAQGREIDIVLKRLTEIENDAKEALRRNERLWQYLGLLTGLMILVLLY